MKIYFAADHAGFALKEKLVAFVRDELEHTVEDFGADELHEDDDYPDFVCKAVSAVSAYPGSRAVVLGGSGQGEAMLSNRLSDVRAAVYYGGPMEIVSLSREHNDANVLSLGARFITDDEAFEAVRLWLSTDFSEEPRHTRRLNKFPL